MSTDKKRNMTKEEKLKELSNYFQISDTDSDFYSKTEEEDDVEYLKVIDFFRTPEGKNILKKIDKEPVISLEEFLKLNSTN